MGGLFPGFSGGRAGVAGSPGPLGFAGIAGLPFDLSLFFILLLHAELYREVLPPGQQHFILGIDTMSTPLVIYARYRDFSGNIFYLIFIPSFFAD